MSQIQHVERGTIVPFEKGARPRRFRDLSGPGERGRILLFTGVRYERPALPIGSGPAAAGLHFSGPEA